MSVLVLVVAVGMAIVMVVISSSSRDGGGAVGGGAGGGAGGAGVAGGSAFASGSCSGRIWHSNTSSPSDAVPIPARVASCPAVMAVVARAMAIFVLLLM